jgi:hypothetical protein
MPRRPTKDTPAKLAARMRSWRVSLLRGRAQPLGIVEAPDERAAEAAAVEQSRRPPPIWTQMGYLFGQKRKKVGRLQRQAARCFLVTREANSVELSTWCWPRVVLIEKRPLTECERSSMNRAARSVGARRLRRLGRNNWIWRLPDDVAARWR